MKHDENQQAACQNQEPGQSAAENLGKRSDLSPLLQHPFPRKWILPEQITAGVPVIQHKAQAVKGGAKNSHGKIG